MTLGDAIYRIAVENGTGIWAYAMFVILVWWFRSTGSKS